MKKGLKWKLITLLTLVASLFVFAGCKLNDTKEDILNKYELTVSVTYYANGDGANFGTAASTTEEETDSTASDSSTEETEAPKAPVKTKTLWYKTGSVALNIGVVNPTSGSATIEWDGYDFKGWYYVVRDENGKIVYEADGTMKLGEAVDFTKPLEAGKHLEFCADWRKRSEVKVMIAEVDGVAETEAKQLTSFTFYQNQVTEPSNRVYEVSSQKYTVLEYYKTADFSEKLGWPIAEPVEDDAEDVIIYAKCIKGAWTLIKTKEDVKSFFGSAQVASNAFYLYNDIDCTGLDPIKPMIGFNAAFRGNGHTISNLNIAYSDESAMATSFAMFGYMGSTAKLQDVTFKNVHIDYTTKANKYVYLIFTEMYEANGVTATVSNVKFDGISMTVHKPDEVWILNIYDLEAGNHDDRSNWLYGGAEVVNDNEFDLDIEYTTEPTLTITK